MYFLGRVVENQIKVHLTPIFFFFGGDETLQHSHISIYLSVYISTYQYLVFLR